MACDGLLEADPARYLAVLRSAFDGHYAEASDVWTADQEMRAFPAVVLGYRGRQSSPAALRVLDVGCGAGRDVEYFARSCASVVGLDLHPHAEWSAVAGRRPNAAFVETDLVGYTTAPGGFDLVFDNGCFHHQHPTQYGAYLAQVNRMLASNGWYVLSTFKNDALKERLDDRGRLHRYFTDSELHAVLAESSLVVLHELDVWRERHRDYYRLTCCGPARAPNAP